MTEKRALPESLKKLIDSGDLMWGDNPELVKEFLPTGILSLDNVLGGGLVRGLITIWYGDFSTGKTLLALRAIRACQERGELCAFIDAEQTYNEDWAKRAGVDTEALVVSQPKTGEKAINVVSALLQTDQFSLIVIDSLAALVPTAVADEDMEKGAMGRHAQLITRALMKMLANNQHTAILCINHVRASLGNVPGETVPGGMAQKQYAVVMCKVGRAGWLKRGETRVGFTIYMRNTKNKVGEPFLEAKVPFYFGRMIDEQQINVDYAIDNGLVEGRAPFYQWNGNKYHGKDALYTFFRENPAEYQALLTLVGNAGVGVVTSSESDDE